MRRFKNFLGMQKWPVAMISGAFFKISLLGIAGLVILGAVSAGRPCQDCKLQFERRRVREDQRGGYSGVVRGP